MVMVPLLRAFSAAAALAALCANRATQSAATNPTANVRISSPSNRFQAPLHPATLWIGSERRRTFLPTLTVLAAPPYLEAVSRSARPLSIPATEPGSHPAETDGAFATCLAARRHPAQPHPAQ